MSIYVIDGAFDCCQFKGVIIRNFNLECLLKLHDKLNQVERISAKIFLEARFQLDFLFVYLQLFHSDFLNLANDRAARSNLL